MVWSEFIGLVALSMYAGAWLTAWSSTRRGRIVNGKRDVSLKVLCQCGSSSVLYFAVQRLEDDGVYNFTAGKFESLRSDEPVGNSFQKLTGYESKLGMLSAELKLNGEFTPGHYLVSVHSTGGRVLWAKSVRVRPGESAVCVF